MQSFYLYMIPRKYRESVLEYVDRHLLLDVVVLLLSVDLGIVLGLKHAPHELGKAHFDSFLPQLAFLGSATVILLLQRDARAGIEGYEGDVSHLTLARCGQLYFLPRNF